MTRIDLRYEYPAFANLPPREERDGGDIYAPAGTKVRVRVHTDKPIASGQMVFAARRQGTAGPVPCGRRATGCSKGNWSSRETIPIAFGLTDRDGLRSSGDTEYFLRVMDDRPPDVRILRPAGDQQITPLEEVAIEARAEDDYGISRFDLVYAVAGREPKVVPFARTSGNDHRQGRDAHAGGRGSRRAAGRRDYLLRPRARRRPRQAVDARPEATCSSSRSGRSPRSSCWRRARPCPAWRASRSRRSWPRRRRSSTRPGTSSGARRRARADRPATSRAIAAAQAELKSRAEQMASRTGRGRGAIRFPQQVTPPRQVQGVRPPSDPVGAAISAMTRAIDQLEGQRTGEALPHEMAALQGLLQAQAEVRQARGGAAGRGRRWAGSAGRARTCRRSSTRSCSGSSAPTTRRGRRPRRAPTGRKARARSTGSAIWRGGRKS